MSINILKMVDNLKKSLPLQNYRNVAVVVFTDKVYTVFLTVTNQIFTDRLKDIESLEFLNLAEKLQVAVRISNIFFADIIISVH